MNANNHPNNKNLLWFDNNCRRKRANFRKWARIHKQKQTVLTFENRRKAHGDYKKTLKSAYNRYVRDTHKRIRTLRSSDPKSYWKLVNGNSNDKKQVVDSISHEIFQKHFEQLSNIPEDELFSSSHADESGMVNEKLNDEIKNEEVLKNIKRLKNNKSSEYDGILNEFLKASSSKLLKVITKLFNLLLKIGMIPSSWSVGYISPIYKGKGDIKDPDNYRGITVLSCFGKLFSSVLNTRIYDFLNENNLLGNEQAGFRKGHSTTDHIFSLHCLVDLYLQRRKRLYCTFVDYKKCFDSIQHSLLWDKLLCIGVNGNVLRVVQDMYKKAKSCVKTCAGMSTEFFFSNIGLRQGENLSPVFYSIFINDLKEFLAINVTSLNLPFSLANEFLFDDVDAFVHLFLLLYADDAVVLTETQDDMQCALNMLKSYCEIWGLNINVNKTRVLVFSRGKIRNIPKFFFGVDEVGVVFDYKYLGVLFNYNNNFAKAMKERRSAANRAMFLLLKRCRSACLPLDIQLDLFEKCVYPILLYGCEVWGFSNLEICKRFQLRFLKLILKLNKSTPTCMVLGEVGMFPVELEVKSRMLSYWYSIHCQSVNGFDKISCLLYRLCAMQNVATDFTLPWLKHVLLLLDQLGFSFLKFSAPITLNQFKFIVRQRLKDQYLQSWRSELRESGVCVNYRLFKENFCLENYLVKLPYSLSQNLLKFRVCNHRLPIQSGRIHNIPSCERICTLCTSNEIGDEFHYLFICQNDNIRNSRKKHLSKYFLCNCNILKFNSIMNFQSKTKLIHLAKFALDIMREF